MTAEHMDRCSCGIYACKCSSWGGDGSYRGVVALWGDVEICQKGARGQFAELRALCVPPMNDSVLHRRLRETYPKLKVFRWQWAMVRWMNHQQRKYTRQHGK